MTLPSHDMTYTPKTSSPMTAKEARELSQTSFTLEATAAFNEAIQAIENEARRPFGTTEVTLRGTVWSNPNKARAAAAGKLIQLDYRVDYVPGNDPKTIVSWAE